MNSEMSLFNPLDLEMSRSTFEYHPTRSGTCNAGRLIPLLAFHTLPGDSIKMNAKSLIKMSTPVYPTMDVLYCDLAFFFIPYKLILGRRYGNPSANELTWYAVLGAQDNLVNSPLPNSQATLPEFSWDVNDDEIKDGTLLDYFCLDTTIKPVTGTNETTVEFPDVNALPALAYFAVWNENYRDESTTQPVTWSYSSSINGTVQVQGSVPIFATKYEVSQVTGSTPSDDYVKVNALGGGAVNQTSSTANKWLPFPVFRFHGYFGSALPWPQRNSVGVQLPLGDTAPVFSGDQHLSNYAKPNSPIMFGIVTSAGGTLGTVNNRNISSNWDHKGMFSDAYDSDAINGSLAGITNLWTDLSAATAANVNALRAAIQKQRWYEKLARSGNRYDELEYGLFGVRPKDAGLDRPLYLGGKRFPLNVEMVASTNGGSGESSSAGAGSLGALGAFSHTNDDNRENGNYFVHSFDDWGIVLAVTCIRHHDTFGSGIDRHWFKKTRDDLYFPTFAHLGEMAIEKREIGSDVSNKDVFGYNQAWEEYRVEHDRVCGLLKPGRSLDFMTYARKFDGDVTLADFLNASAQVATVDKTLAVSSNTSGFQFVYQFTFDFTARRCIPEYSVPGLMDHF